MKQRALHSSISPANSCIYIRVRLRIVLSWILLTSTSHHPAILHRWNGGLEGSSNSAATATAFSLASIFPRMKTEKVGTGSNIHTIQETSDEIVKSMFHNNNMVNVLQNTSPNGQPLQQDLNVSGSNLYTISQQQQQQQQQRTLAEFDQEQQYTENTSCGSPIVARRDRQERSVHLQLNEMGGGGTATVCRPGVEQQREVNVDEENINHEERAQSSSDQPKTTQVRVLSYVDSSNTSGDHQEWVALNTSRRKFLAFLDYNNVSSVNKQAITTKTLSLPEPPGGVDQQNDSDDGAEAPDAGTECAVRKEWRALWKAQRLLTDRTEILAVYKSDTLSSNSSGEAATEAAEAVESDDVTTRGLKKPKRGGFSDLLNLYTHRLVAILNDERRDEQNPPEERHHSSLVRVQQRDRFGQSVTDESNFFQTDHRILIKWLEDHYGVAETQMLQASRFRTLPVPTQLELMSHFLSWFRNHFPYYYDRCDSCGASQKDDLAAAQQAQDAESLGVSGSDISHNAETHDEHDGHDHEDDSATFLGYIYPSEVELKGKASRTELYQCHKCSSFTRFPRFNSAFDIIQSQRGRCGEYSLLLYRFLRALNHDARWVVDWADHVWAEVLIGSNQHNRNSNIINNSKSNGDSSSERWVHLDPCEAAVDNPLLYESWGKKQTYIIALYAPLRYQVLRSQLQQKQKFAFLGSLRSLGNDNTKALMIEDVTHQYTSDTMETIRNRRDESEEEVEAAISNGIEDLQSRLLL